MSCLGFAAGYPFFFRVYLSEGTKHVYKAIDYKSAVEGYTLCKTHDFSRTQKPDELCLDFFKHYVPQVFETSKKDEFPLSFTDSSELLQTYNLVQKDLTEYGVENLPPISELTIGWIKS